jgi:hypothetical protein
MPPFANQFGARVRDALELARAGELAGSALGRREWPSTRIELLYEIAYLKVFVQWEVFLENTFLRYLCGYRSGHGIFAPVTMPVPATLGAAQVQVSRGRDFLLWHDPDRVISRSRTFLVQCPHENVLASHSSRLAHFSAVRHRIVHEQEDARSKFDLAAIQLAGRRYPASRPGRFLRDWDSTTVPPRRWLETLGTELRNLAAQIA